jgi:hypothetical protein
LLVGSGNCATSRVGRCRIGEARGHHTGLVLAVSATVPEQWSCRCAWRAAQDQTQPPEPAIEKPFNTHFDHLRDRRPDAAAVAALGDALSRL